MAKAPVSHYFNSSISQFRCRFSMSIINCREEMNQLGREGFDPRPYGDSGTSEGKLSSNWNHFNINYQKKKTNICVTGSFSKR